MGEHDGTATLDIPDDSATAPAVLPSADWMTRAVCRQVDPEIFFGEAGRWEADAKRICGRCPVRDQCLQDAQARNEEWGIWGGLTPAERRALPQGDRENLQQAS